MKIYIKIVLAQERTKNYCNKKIQIFQQKTKKTFNMQPATKIINFTTIIVFVTAILKKQKRHWAVDAFLLIKKFNY